MHYLQVKVEKLKKATEVKIDSSLKDKNILRDPNFDSRVLKEEVATEVEKDKTDENLSVIQLEP